jgi:uncharacterized membrane protein YphA (DoxX/SURF4 family)
VEALVPHLAMYAGWLGLGLLSLIFLANAFGIVDPARAVHELAEAEATLPGWLAPSPAVMVALGRVLQLAAVPALFFTATRPFAALALAGFLVPATLTAHAFWRAGPGERGAQLVNFLKNASLVGGLLVAAGWTGA